MTNVTKHKSLHYTTSKCTHSGALWSWNWVHTLGQCEIYWGRIKAVRLLQCWSRCL